MTSFVGIPVLVVGISLAVVGGSPRGIQSYTQLKACWISYNHHVIWTVVVPAALVIVVSIYMGYLWYRVTWTVVVPAALVIVVSIYMGHLWYRVTWTVVVPAALVIVDKSQKVFAFAFVRLMQRDGTTLKDGTHELMVFKCNSTKVLPSTYLQSASFKIEQTLMNPPTKGGADAAAYCNDKFNIKTLLCSTKLTQNRKDNHCITIRCTCKQKNLKHRKYSTCDVSSYQVNARN
ncbi:predicted protein [Nematostella vectensis]|uniref:C2 DOCK-type domain-containing protein n=1 Tax=Nematostella vectensis TaxID=45351 RepID=A7SG52_NEMVE|nr:predicted protein [Nematostella vectensis]|eukprot:XP_001629397.1 predicted protein [Nematostella vectensis]